MSYNFTLDNMSEFMCSSVLKDNFSVYFPHNLGSMICEKQVVTEDIFFLKPKQRQTKVFRYKPIQKSKD